MMWRLFAGVKALMGSILMLCAAPVLAAQDPARDWTEQSVVPGEHPYDGLGDFIDGMANSHMHTLDVSAMTVSIVKDGRLIFAKGYGLQNREKNIPVSAETSLFRIGSTSKLFTWTAIMQLLEQGRIDLDVDVNTYLKDFQIPDTFPEPITMRHIITHTAGFEDGALGYLINYDPERALTLRDAMQTYLPKRINPPGKYASYSNYATALAGLIVENITGVSFSDYVEQNIYAPLGMTNATFREPVPESLSAGQTIGYFREGGALVPQPYELIGSFGPAGAMAASATDMARFMVAHLQDGRLNGEQILKPETALLMHTALYQGDARLGAMAYGFYEEWVNGHRLIGHGGDTAQFHTEMLLDKAEGLGIFVSYATRDDRAGRDTFVRTFYDRYYPAPLPDIEPPADFEDRASDYAGTYRFWRHNESTIEKAMAILSGGLDVTPSGEGTLIFAGRHGPRQFVEIGENLFRQVDGPQRIAFGENADGEIQDLFIDGLPFMDASRVPAFETSLYSQVLPLICFLVFVSVFVDWLYRRRRYKEMQLLPRIAIGTSMAVAGANLLFLLFLGMILASYGMHLYLAIPTVFDVNLILPIVASLLSIGLVAFAVVVWLKGVWGLGRRVYFSIVAGCALYMTIYYSYWNILGFQHF